MAAMAPGTLAEDLSLLLSQASHALVTEMTVALAELGISPRAYCVLCKARPGGLTQTQLAELCRLDKTTMVVTIDELERAGLAKRRLSPTDRRARIITVTEAGERMLDDARGIVERVHEDVLAALPERQRAAFLDALVRLAQGRLSTPAQCDRPVRRRAPRAPANDP